MAPKRPPIPSHVKTFIARLPRVEVKDLPSDQHECNICMATFPRQEPTNMASSRDWDTPLRLPCLHVMGKNCLTTWLAKANTCPICRAKLFDKIGIQRRRGRHIVSRSRNLPPPTRIPEPGSFHTRPAPVLAYTHDPPPDFPQARPARQAAGHVNRPQGSQVSLPLFETLLRVRPVETPRPSHAPPPAPPAQRNTMTRLSEIGASALEWTVAGLQGVARFVDEQLQVDDEWFGNDVPGRW